MAHKPNNPTHDFGDQQFDFMLRRHLQRNGSATKPCEGFDAETASAYVERSLLAAANQAYETHLADCAGCRRHVTALVRLQADLAPQSAVAPIPQRTPVLAHESVWTRWMAQVNAWWAEVNFGWGLAGAGALATVLIAGVTISSWQTRTASETSSASQVATNSTGEPATAEAANTAVINDLAMTLNEPALIATTTTTENAAAAKSTGALSSNFPALPNLGAAKPQLASNNYPYGVAPATPMRVIEIPEDVVAMNPEKMMAPMVSLPASREFFGSGFSNNGDVRGTAVSFGQPGAQSGALMPMQLRAIQSPATVNSLNVVKDQLERHSDAAGLVRTDGRKLADKETEADDKNSKLAKAEASRARAILNTLMGQRGVMSFAPGSKGDDSRTKEAEKTTDQPLVKPLTKRVNGHTFYFERGFWIDEDYHSDTTLPLIKLARGSERYQNILIENPTLETFFQLGQVIVVWKGKVYEVRK